MLGQVTSTPPRSPVIGSTDGIVVMGFLIVCIIIPPAISKKKN
jgi:hypothetical protein